MLLLASPALAEPIVGRASVIDGDTLDIRGQRIRLYGIDAPESGQTCLDEANRYIRCGKRSAFALSDKIGASNVSCDPVDRDRYGRVVAVCELGKLDLNAWMVEQGHAMAYRKYSMAYVSEEDAAKTGNRGLWAGAFTSPWNWRKGRRP